MAYTEQDIQDILASYRNESMRATFAVVHAMPKSMDRLACVGDRFAFAYDILRTDKPILLETLAMSDEQLDFLVIDRKQYQDKPFYHIPIDIVFLQEQKPFTLVTFSKPVNDYVISKSRAACHYLGGFAIDTGKTQCMIYDSDVVHLIANLSSHLRPH